MNLQSLSCAVAFHKNCSSGSTRAYNSCREECNTIRSPKTVHVQTFEGSDLITLHDCCQGRTQQIGAISITTSGIQGLVRNSLHWKADFCVTFHAAQERAPPYQRLREFPTRKAAKERSAKKRPVQSSNYFKAWTERSEGGTVLHLTYWAVIAPNRP